MQGFTLQQIISDIFAAAMRDKGITQAELARRMGTSRSNVYSMWDQKWTIERTERIARALGINLHVTIKDNRPGEAGEVNDEYGYTN